MHHVRPTETTPGKTKPTSSSWKMSVFDSVAARVLRPLHNIYRPQYDLDQPHARFHIGVLAEVAYSADYDIFVIPNDRTFSRDDADASRRRVSHDLFHEGMYLRAEICGYNRASGKYELHYVDGPYFADEDPIGAVLWKNPKGKKAAIHLSNVAPVHITVDVSDNYSSNWPLTVLLLTLGQAGFFIIYAFLVLPSDSFPPGAQGEPVVGSTSLWMRVVGDFPRCKDARPQAWRLLSYQLVHSGYLHLAANMLFQVVFGLPINMVHGNVRFFMLYQLGVLGGALFYAVLGGGHFSLVGASGGVYSIFGMHFAELLLNWDSQKKGVFNHWTRLLVLGTVMGLDLFSYYRSRSESTSYSAHAGGWLVGCIFGTIFMQNFEVQWYERWFLLPLAKITGFLLAVFCVGWYILIYPPEAAFAKETDIPCCHQLLDCDAIPREDYSSLFRCVDAGTTVLSAATSIALSSCSEFRAELS